MIFIEPHTMYKKWIRKPINVKDIIQYLSRSLAQYVNILSMSMKNMNDSMLMRRKGITDNTRQTLVSISAMSSEIPAVNYSTSKRALSLVQSQSGE